MLMRNAEGMEERMWDSLQGLLFLSSVTSITFNSGFSPMNGLRVSVPVCCLLFHLGDAFHAYQLHVSCDYRKESQLKFEGKGYSKRFFTLVN